MGKNLLKVANEKEKEEKPEIVGVFSDQQYQMEEIKEESEAAEEDSYEFKSSVETESRGDVSFESGVQTGSQINTKSQKQRKEEDIPN